MLGRLLIVVALIFSSELPGDIVLAQTPPVQVDGAIEALKPGEYLWAPDIAPMGPVTIIISLTTQRAYAYRNGAPIGVSTVSTGALGHETPTGIFVILQKAIKHNSNKYSNASMPFMQRLTWDGIAMHAGRLPGYPASHGCIRLPAGFAKQLFEITKLGLTVVITNNAFAPEIVPSPGLLDDGPVDDHEGSQSYRWQPKKAPAGPVTIVVSGRDRRIVVLRNGIEIGSGAITIDGPVTTTEAFTLNGTDSTGLHWLRLPLPGLAPNSAKEMTPEEHARGHFSDELRKNIISVLEPGSTLLITRDSIKSAGTGTRLTVITESDKFDK
jgi:L,D-transpeptidase catalytic domain